MKNDVSIGVDLPYKEELITVIVPIYNVDAYLDRCIKSIINQTYRNLQIILVDDGSNDKSPKICDDYASIDSRIEVIHQINGGLVSARKAGLNRAIGNYIGFVDGDDYVECDMFLKLYNKLIEYDVDFVNSGFKKNDCNEIFCAGREQKIHIDNLKNIYNKYVFDSEGIDHISPSIWSKLFKKELIKRSYCNVADAQSYGEDLICLCFAMKYCDSFANINDAFYHYTIREGSLSNNSDISTIVKQYELYDCLCKVFTEIGCGKEMKKTIDVFFMRRLMQGVSSASGLDFPVYKYSKEDSLHAKRVVLYGAGKVGRDYYRQLRMYTDIELVGWVDSNSNVQSPYYKITAKDSLKEMKFDILLIAVSSSITATKIKEDLVALGIESDKIIFDMPVSYIEC